MINVQTSLNPTPFWHSLWQHPTSWFLILVQIHYTHCMMWVVLNWYQYTAQIEIEQHERNSTEHMCTFWFVFIIKRDWRYVYQAVLTLKMGLIWETSKLFAKTVLLDAKKRLWHEWVSVKLQSESQYTATKQDKTSSYCNCKHTPERLEVCENYKIFTIGLTLFKREADRSNITERRKIW